MATPVLVNTRQPISLQADRMHRVEVEMAKLDEQIATGHRLIDAATDPAAANRLAALERLKAGLAAQKRSIDTTTTRLGIAEGAMEAGQDILLRAKDLALQASNDTLSADDRQTIASETRILKEQLLDSANARDPDGRYLFAGAMNGRPAYTMDADGAVTFEGFAAGPGNTGLASASGAAPNGPSLFGDDTSGAFAALDQLLSALDEPDPAARKEAMATTIDSLDSATGRLTDAQAVLGANMARLDAEVERILDNTMRADEGAAAIDGLDMTKAITQLQTLQLTLQAAQASFVNIYSHSLFDRLA